MKTRNTLGELIAMKKAILDKCLNKELLCQEGAKLLTMHPKSFSRLKSRYAQYGESILVPRKTGPKDAPPPNRTPEYIENIVCDLAIKYSRLGPVDLSDQLKQEYGLFLNQSTVYRILKRKKIRYGYERIQEEKRKPKLYCLETPGLEVQLDACYPFGRGRKLVCFDAIDDCSRWVAAQMYDRETAANAILFVKYLIANVPFRIQRIRIDNRYGHELKEFCQLIGIEVITIEAREPTQNGKIERFHKTIKHEFFWRYCGFYDDHNLIQCRLNQWLSWYNTKRKHSGYGMNRMTPQMKIAASLFNSLYIIPQEKVTLTLQSQNLPKIKF